MKRFFSLLAVTLLCLAQPALAQTVNTPVPTYMNSSGTNRLAAQGVVCVNPTTALFESCAGSGGVGAFTGLTNTELRAVPLPVTGTFWQTTQPVSGPLTDAQLRASLVGTTALTDTQLRASAVPISSTQLTTLLTGLIAQNSVTSGQVGQLAFCASLTGATARTTSNSHPLQCEASTGALRVGISSGSVGITAGTNIIGYVGSTSWFTDTVAVLASGATLTPLSRDAGSVATTISFTSFGCSVYSNQPGTAGIDSSVDGTTWYPAMVPAAYTASVPLDIQVNVRTRYHRCTQVNGATASTINRVLSSYRD